jgi:hypothetical protein
MKKRMTRTIPQGLSPRARIGKPSKDEGEPVIGEEERDRDKRDLQPTSEESRRPGRSQELQIGRQLLQLVLGPKQEPIDGPAVHPL